MAGLDRLADAPAACHVAREHRGGKTILGGVRTMDGIGFVVEDLESLDRAEDLVLHHEGVKVLHFDQAGAVEGAARQRSFGHGTAAHEDVGVGSGFGDDGVDAPDARGIDQGAELGVEVVARAEPDLPVGLDERRTQCVGDAALDQHTRAGAAELAVHHDERRHDLWHHHVQVGIVEHDQRRLAAQFQVQALERFRAVRGDDTADLGTTGVADHVHGRGIDQHRCRDTAGFRNDVQHARRQRGGGGNRLGEQPVRQRRLVRQLQYHGAAGCQRRSEGAHGQHDRRIPRRDHAHHPDRLGIGDKVHAGCGFECAAAGLQQRGRGGVTQPIHRDRQFPLRLRQQLAAFTGKHQRHRVGTLRDLPRQLEQSARTAIAVFRPAGRIERGAGRVDGVLRFVLADVQVVTERAAVRGTDGFPDRAAAAPGTVDPVSCRFLHVRAFHLVSFRCDPAVERSGALREY